MLANLIVWLGLLALAVLFGWLVTRAWRARRWYIKWPGVLLSCLLSLLVLAIVVVGAIGMVQLYAPRGTQAPNIQVASTPEKVQRGQHLAGVFCASCHSPNNELPMTGGVNMSKDIPIPVGAMVTANLTPGGRIGRYTDGQIMRVLREGTDPQGRRLVVMSSLLVRHMSDDDLEAIIAYLRSQPAVQSQVPDPPDQLNYLGVLISGMGMIPEAAPVTGVVTAPAKGPTAEYGAYMISFQDCIVCHGVDLSGGKSAISPNGPSLHIIKGWTQDQFIQTLRTGVNPDGHSLGEIMPWKAAGKMDDDELAAVYKYITSK